MKKTSLSAFAAHRRYARMVPVVYGLLLLSGPPAIAQEAVHKDVPYVPTPPAVVETMLKLGEVQKGDILYDLGCGDGRIVVDADFNDATALAATDHGRRASDSASTRITCCPQQGGSGHNGKRCSLSVRTLTSIGGKRPNTAGSFHFWPKIQTGRSAFPVKPAPPSVRDCALPWRTIKRR